MVRSKRLQIAIVSTNSGRTTGGLEAYTRLLARHLSAQCDVSAVARFGIPGRQTTDYAAAETPRTLRPDEEGGMQTRIIAPHRAWRRVLGRLRHVTSRPPLDITAVTVFKAAYQPSLGATMPQQLDVVHYIGTGLELLGFAALAEARKRGAAFTVLPAAHPGTWGDGALDVRLYNQADAVLTLSRYESEHLISHGVESSRLKVVGLAPAAPAQGDGQTFRVRHDLGERPLVLFIARKNKYKGYHALRQAMLQVLEVVPACCLVAVGPEGELPYPPLPEQALLDLGRADEQEKADALAACDVFCMPSNAESFGIVYVEAWLHGKPVVGGPAPAVRELITEGVNGLCVSQNPAEIAEALTRLLTNPSLAQRMGLAGRALQQERYTWEAVSAAHQQLFHSLRLRKRPARKL